eukprot:EC719359.1.p1 GENE.EC719359.1~~EC719359.1.p1  ORF type:complete len:89 (+),score=9.48 EC719359.1:169-435(+)
MLIFVGTMGSNDAIISHLSSDSFILPMVVAHPVAQFRTLDVMNRGYGPPVVADLFPVGYSARREFYKVKILVIVAGSKSFIFYNIDTK